MQPKQGKFGLNITIVGPGIMPIPPESWGAVEILIWNCKEELESLGHNVQIVNTSSRKKIISECNSRYCDFVHIHYDHYWDVIPHLKCKNIAITSHNPYLDQPEKFSSIGFSKIHKGMLSLASDKRVRIAALSRSIQRMYIRHGFPREQVVMIHNGVEYNKFNFLESCEHPDRSIYLGKIDGRKCQYKYQSIRSLYFAGRVEDKRFKSKNHIGEWTKQEVYENLTKYANLVLLSSAEAHPLVCMEALSAGLGLVVSPRCSAHLDVTEEFIDVIPFSKLEKIDYVRKTIKENREKSIHLRKQIRNYARGFKWDRVIRKYVDVAEAITNDDLALTNTYKHYFSTDAIEGTSFFSSKREEEGFSGFGMGRTE